MNQYFIDAIYILYPQVVSTRDNEAFDVNGNPVVYDPVLVQAKANKLECKDKATTILQNTDWTSISDVGDPVKANPYLINQAEFIAYRSTVRNYAVNPVENPVWPTVPTEQWSS